MPRPEEQSRPQLATGCRWGDASGPDRMLLFPEGAIRVRDSGRQVLEYCDGDHTFAEIVHKLQALYTAADNEQIKKEAGDFLARLQEKRIVDF